MTQTQDSDSCALPSVYRMILFVAGNEKNSRLARQNLIRFCEGIPVKCETQIVDVLEDFTLAIKHNILLTPALMVLKPEPGSIIIGNLANTQKLYSILGINSHEENK
jgi:hypothetical protein